MKTIYLISTDGYRESIILDYYAVDKEGIIRIIKDYVKEYFFEETVKCCH